MSGLTERQVAVMRRAAETDSDACTNWLTPKGMTVAQTGNVCRQLEAKGYMARRATYAHAWGITSSGRQWLRSLDAGRPWMVRGWKAGRPTPSPTHETGGRDD